MEYNSQREPIKLREYGRSIQKLVDFASTLEDKAERQDVAEHILSIMGGVNPHLKNVEDFKHLLWDHLHLMADYELEVDSPYPKPDKETLAEKPAKLDYPNKNIRYKHYGKNILSMIKSATKMEDKEKQLEYAKCIANYMKKVQASRKNNGEVVNDLIIINDLESISDGVLKLEDETTLTKVKVNRNYKNKNNKNNNNRKRNNNNNNNNRKRNNR
ncbi:MAG: DUF4290 domain-containing protein [Chitinophagales bacterium]